MLHPTIEIWTSILQDDRVVTPLGIKTLQILYSMPEHEGSAGEVAKRLGIHFGPINLEVGKIGRRIIQYYPDVEIEKREDGTNRFWSVPFTGRYSGTSFFWKLKPELASALELLQLHILPEPPPLPVDITINPESALDQSFGLERHLHDFLNDNWASTPLGKEWTIDLDDGASGYEYRTNIGRIDFLAKHRSKPEWLVIELKRGQSDDQTIGQILRYIGWVKEHLASDKDLVKGLIISKDGNDKLYYALKMVSDISVQLYEVEFRLKEFSGKMK